jgi:hypothetical protein
MRSPTYVLFRKHGTREPILVGNWRKLRCETCGGSLYIDEIEKVQARKELTAEQLFGRESRRQSPGNHKPSS